VIDAGRRGCDFESPGGRRARQTSRVCSCGRMRTPKGSPHATKQFWVGWAERAGRGPYGIQRTFFWRENASFQFSALTDFSLFAFPHERRYVSRRRCSPSTAPSRSTDSWPPTRSSTSAWRSSRRAPFSGRLAEDDPDSRSQVDRQRRRHHEAGAALGALRAHTERVVASGECRAHGVAGVRSAGPVAATPSE
jgi:hypothetical protein